MILLSTSLGVEGAALGDPARIVRSLPSPTAWPAMFSTPWAARAGYDPSYLSEVSNPVPSSEILRVHLTLTPRSPALFATRGPGATALTVSQIADTYGRSSSDYSGLESYFESFGLTILHTDPSRLSLSVEGPAASVGRAFGTSIESGSLGGASVRFPATAPTLPASIGPQISAVSGLSDGFHRFTLPIQGAHPVIPQVVGPVPSRTTNLISPTAAHLAYGLSDLYNFSGGTHWATGQDIVLLLWGLGFDDSDIRTFFAKDYPSNFPSETINYYPINQNAVPGPAALNDPSHAPQELTLDIEWAGSAAPGATLDAVYAPDGPANRGYSPADADMEDALSTAASLANVRAISMSFGTPDGSDPSFQQAFETGFAVATQRGITLLAASGDNGGLPSSGSCPTGGPAPQYPAASPQVLAVGGSAPILNESLLGTVTGLASETAWNGSGGGFSTSYKDPSWQLVGSAAAPVGSAGHRGIPDVAGPSVFNRFYYHGQPMAGNGTSFATPFWAGMITEMDALLSQPLGFVTPRLYAIAAAQSNGTKAIGLADVTGESGTGCLPSGPGWDDTTGWGTPRAALLFEDLEGTFVDVALHVASTTVAPGGAADATVIVVNASSHQPIAGLPIHYTLTADPSYVGPCGGTMASTSATTGALGEAESQLTVPTCFFGTTVTLTVSTFAGGYFGSNSTTIEVNLLGLAGFLAIAQVYPYNIVIFAGIMSGAIALGVALGNLRRSYARRRARPEPPPPTNPPPEGPGAGAPPAPEAVEPAGAPPSAAPVTDFPEPGSSPAANPPAPAPSSPPSDGPGPMEPSNGPETAPAPTIRPPPGAL